MVNESRKTMRLPQLKELKASGMTVRLPLFRPHGEGITAQFSWDIYPKEARVVLRNAPGVIIANDPGEVVYPM